jgi:hypothetical protein
MFRVTVDIFSGRPNPSWIVVDEAEGRKVLDTLSQNPELISQPDTGYQGLGYRGVNIELLSDEDTEDFKLPANFSLANSAGANLRQAGKIASQLIEGMTQYDHIPLPEHTLTPIDKNMQKLLLEQLEAFVKKPPKTFKLIVPYTRGARTTIKDERCPNCEYEISSFNPAFWNSDPNVTKHNNCYNYALNLRTNTNAQPGYAHGCHTYPMACPEVVQAALCDGLHKRCDCLPSSQYPRRLLALVIWPGLDYHWYRQHLGGFWGHKFNDNPVRNTDNSGVLIANPETCKRGDYSDFCGYFYAGKGVTII